MSYDHHASLFNGHWSFWFLCAVAVMISMFSSDAVYQYVLFRKCCAHACQFTAGARFTSMLLVLSRVSPKHLLAGLPSAVPDDRPSGGIIHFPQSGVESDSNCLTFFFFLFLLSQISAMQTHRLSSLGRKTGKAGCSSCNCDQDQFAGYLGNENKEVVSGTLSFPVFG